MPLSCPNCGSPVEERDLFCGRCAAALDEVPEASSSALAPNRPTDTPVTPASESSLTRALSSDEQELKEQEALLSALEADVAEKELALETLKAEIHVFEVRYLRIVGIKYADLDRIRARIAELKAKQQPEDAAAQEDAQRARVRAEESESARAGIDLNRPAPAPFLASEELRRLYREAAKMVHPDLARDEADRIVRTKLMADVNRAYQAEDEEGIRRIMAEWQDRAEPAESPDLAARLRRVGRKISSLQARLDAIEIEIENLRSSDLHRLKLRVEEAEAEGRDLLSDMAIAVDQDIQLAKDELEELTSRHA